ncbi:MAG: response regulator [Bacteroidaceae bacterium]|nr:response regulator [Bacteroidaceae bacterium]
MTRFLLFILLYSILGTLGVSAQNVLFFDSQQGLSNSRISSISEDSRRNIWLTTQNGLNRYDGVKMNVYRRVIGDSLSLMHDESTCVFEHGGELFVGTGAGLQLYDYETDKFRHIPFVMEDGTFIRGRVVSINLVNKKRVIVCMAGYGAGELKTGADGQQYIQHISEFNTEEVAPTHILEDLDGNLWVLNARRDFFKQVHENFHKYDELSNVRRVCMSSSGRVYAATVNGGIFMYNEAKDCFDMVASAEEVGASVTGIEPWETGKLFVTTDGAGLRIYDENTHKITLSAISVKDFDFATSNTSCSMYDSYGNVWVGVYLKGVMMKPMGQSVFEYIGQNSITKNTIGANSVFAMAEAKGQPGFENGMWVAVSNEGLYLLTSDGARSKHWSVQDVPSMPSSFTAVLNHDPSTVLLGTFLQGLWQMKEGRFVLLTKEINMIFDIQPAKEDDCFWISTIGAGVFYYNLKTGKFLNYRGDYSMDSRTDILGNPYVYATLLVKDKLFVGTSDGLTVCFPEEDGIIRKSSKKLLSGNSVRYMVLSDDGTAVWVATNSGLVKVDGQSLDVREYTTADGLPVNSIVSLCVDGGDLWIGTDYGLSCMDVKAETFANFFSNDGLQENEFCRGAVLSQNGHIYFGGIGGITYFDVRKMKRWRSEERELKLRFVDVFMNGKAIHKGDMSGDYEMLTGLIDECGRIEMSHQDNSFVLELSATGLNNQHVVYEYSINGDRWMDQGGDNDRLIFGNLAAGTYTIKIRANALGTVSEERELVAVVHPAWYASTWAKIVYFLFFLLLCWMCYEYVRRQFRLRRVMERNRQQRELNETRVQFFMNISHEIRTPMTLILAPLEKLISKDKDEERLRNYHLMKQNAQRILQLINQMMDVRKIEQGKFLLDYRQVELVGLLQSIFDVFVSTATTHHIKYQFIRNVEQLMVYADPENLDKIVMNLLSNAFKFTPDGGSIVMRLESDGERFELEVMDSGVGISDEEKKKVFERFYSAQHRNGYIGTGIGLNLTSMLVKLHQGTIRVEDNPEGKGACFVVNIPIGEESLKMMKPADVPEGAVEEKEGTKMEDLLAVERSADGRKKNAVLVEDDEAIRMYVHSELSSDLVVHLCSNGQEAWDYILAQPDKVDVVISDIMMPVMDGMTLCQKLKANFMTNHIPILLMTALGSDADRIAGITNGADAYVSKPFNIDVLRATALQLMRTRKLLQGKFHGDKQHEENIDKVELESPDEHLMKRVMKVINENLDNSDLSVEFIADKVGVSRVHFYRKMKDLTGQAPRDFLKYVRLKEAARMLSEKKLDITGVSVATGFKSLSAFSTNFKILYGISPTEYQKKNEEKRDANVDIE